MYVSCNPPWPTVCVTVAPGRTAAADLALLQRNKERASEACMLPTVASLHEVMIGYTSALNLGPCVQWPIPVACAVPPARVQFERVLPMLDTARRRGLYGVADSRSVRSAADTSTAARASSANA